MLNLNDLAIKYPQYLKHTAFGYFFQYGNKAINICDIKKVELQDRVGLLVSLMINGESIFTATTEEAAGKENKTLLSLLWFFNEAGFNFVV